MHFISRFLNWGGFTSVALGGLLALVGVWKGKEARQLEGAQQFQSLSALKQVLNLVPLIVAISGRVFAKDPIKGELTGEEGAIVQVTEERLSERRAEGVVWVKETNLVRSLIREAEWGVKDASGNFVPVVAGQDAGGSFMQTTADQFQPSNEKLAEAVLGELSGRRFLGTRKVERMLQVGTHVTAVGELAAVLDKPGVKGALRSRGMMYVLRAPKAGGPFVITERQLPDLIASLKATSATCSYLAKMCATLGAGMLVLSAVQQAALWWRHKRIRERQERARRALGAAAAGAAAAAGGSGGSSSAQGAEGGGASADRPLCVVCLSRNVEQVFPSCGHMCVCRDCSRTLNRCPMCRTRGSPIPVYTP